MGQTSDELKAQLEEQRTYLGRDLVAIEDRVSPSRVIDRRRTRMRQGWHDARRQVQGSPLVAGAVAFGAGMLLAIALPPTEKERQLAEGHEDQLRSAADSAKQAVTSAAQDAADHLKPEAEQAMADVRDTASQAAEQVKQTAGSAKDDVAQQASSGAGQSSSTGQPSTGRSSTGQSTTGI